MNSTDYYTSDRKKKIDGNKNAKARQEQNFGGHLSQCGGILGFPQVFPWGYSKLVTDISSIGVLKVTNICHFLRFCQKEDGSETALSTHSASSKKGDIFELRVRSSISLAGGSGMMLMDHAARQFCFFTTVVWNWSIGKHVICGVITSLLIEEIVVS